VRQRDGYPAGVPCWVDTSQPDPEAAAEFYAGLFGWRFTDRMPADAPGRYLVAQLDGRDVAAVGSQPDGPSQAVWNTYVWVDSADEAAARVTGAGGRVVSEPFDVLDAGRMAVVADPDGALFCFWQAGTHRGAQAVNEPGSWVFSELNTRDPDGAEAFYGAVFGWEADRLDFGGGETAMWRLPGYGEFLERTDPGLRERQADEGAPAGFADAVAWMIPITSGDAPPHWSVTFSVEDADAAASRATALGGEVVMPPFDAPFVRMAVLRDPAGAAFTISRYDPDAG
jgi:uncharacterized protein